MTSRVPWLCWGCKQPPILPTSASSLPAGLAFHPEGHIRHQRTIPRVAELQKVPTLRESEMPCAAIGAAGKAWAPTDDALPLLPFREPPEVLGAGQKRCRSRTSPETPLVEEIETAEAVRVVGRAWQPNQTHERRQEDPPVVARALSPRPLPRSRKAPCRARRRFCVSVALGRRWRRRWQ